MALTSHFNFLKCVHLLAKFPGLFEGEVLLFLPACRACGAVPPILTCAKLLTMQKKLLKWFAENQRPLPWRKNYEPYQVWISEIMLQQTQVTTMLPYFDRWMKELPTIEALASASEDKLLKLWEGLGYYSRARNLQKAAKILTSKNEGRLYEDFDLLLELPGIGRYTAGAIMSIAYNKDFPVVDGNVVRVLARLRDYRENVKDAGEFFWNEAVKLLPKGQARDFNQALMEFGALHCTPKSPDCANCPLKGECKAFAAGTQDGLPNKGVARAKKAISVAVGIIRRDGKVFIQKRRDQGLMAGLWEFPGGQVENGETASSALEREIQEELGVTMTDVRPFMRLKHAYTSYQVDLHCFLADYSRGQVQLKAATEGKWVKPEELKNYAFPAANGKIIKALLNIDS
jgi:A/G-specific adenine glycosylase